MSKKNLKEFAKNLAQKAKEVFVNKSPFSKPDIKGYINPFIDIEVICKGESLLHESLAMIINTRMKDYNLLEGYDIQKAEIILRLPTGGQMNFPLIVKSLDDKLYRQRGDNQKQIGK